jgi:hypothetical protein
MFWAGFKKGGRPFLIQKGGKIMRTLLFLLAVPFLLTSCNAQEAKTQSDTKKEITVNKPKVDVKVNKQYDEDGNLIAYDSTYVWSYNNKTGQAVDINVDSLLLQFKPMIGPDYSGFFHEHESDFFGDSLFYHDFMMPDYFMNRWQQQLQEMNRMMLEMDSMKQSFFREEYPGLQKQENGKSN